MRRTEAKGLTEAARCDRRLASAGPYRELRPSAKAVVACGGRGEALGREGR